jgi:plastocyanin
MKALAVLSVFGALCAGLVVTVGGTAAPGPCPAGDVQINVISFGYTPSTITVTPGTTVCWTNTSGLPHTVTSVGNFDSATIPPTEIYRHTFSTEGRFAYECTIPSHVMSGEVVVASGPGPAATATTAASAAATATAAASAAASGSSSHGLRLRRTRRTEERPTLGRRPRPAQPGCRG